MVLMGVLLLRFLHKRLFELCLFCFVLGLINACTVVMPGFCITSNHTHYLPYRMANLCLTVGGCFSLFALVLLRFWTQLLCLLAWLVLALYFFAYGRYAL